jgi:hypothetical protein
MPSAGSAAASPAGDHEHGPRSEQRADDIDQAGRGGDHHLRDARRGANPAHGVHQQRLAGQFTQRLRPTRPQSETGTGRRNEDRDVATQGLRGHVAVLRCVEEVVLRPR